MSAESQHTIEQTENWNYPEDTDINFALKGRDADSPLSWKLKKL
jgi:hypothetical protein